jgi:hypothetical protein
MSRGKYSNLMGEMVTKLVKYDYINNSGLFDYIHESIGRNVIKKIQPYMLRDTLHI